VLALTPTEYRLLCVLAERPGEVVAHQELTERVWGYHDQGVRRSLEVHVRRLRTILNRGGRETPQLVTRRGFGYRLMPPAEQERRHPRRNGLLWGHGGHHSPATTCSIGSYGIAPEARRRASSMLTT
jgi:DNA-binding winged helix-turn-helix (wHTH) protein